MAQKSTHRLRNDITKRLRFNDAEFDTVIISDVLEHVPAPEHVWLEMARLLKPGGKVIAHVPFYYCLHETPHDYYRYTEFALRRFADNAGLKMLMLEAIGGVPEVLTDISPKPCAGFR